jgi:hypothetical protein
MAREITQRQRAEELLGRIIGIIAIQPSQREARIEWLLEYATTARQEAMMEAVSKIRSRGDEYMRDCKAKDASGKKYRDTYEMRRVNSGRAWAFKDLADELDRLAREGVKG